MADEEIFNAEAGGVADGGDLPSNGNGWRKVSDGFFPDGKTSMLAYHLHIDTYASGGVVVDIPELTDDAYLPIVSLYNFVPPSTMPESMNGCTIRFDNRNKLRVFGLNGQEPTALASGCKMDLSILFIRRTIGA